MAVSIFIPGREAAWAGGVMHIAGDNVIEIVYRFDEPETGRNGDYDTIGIPGLIQIVIPGEPRLPVKPVRILLPFNREPVRIEVAAAAKTRVPGAFRIEPAQEPVPLSAAGPLQKTPPSPRVYQQAAPYPGRIDDPFDRQHKRAFLFLQSMLYPVEYHPLSGEVYYFPEIRVRVELVPADPPWRVRGVAGGEKPEVQSMVDNPRTVDTYPDPS
jgi:hypothetical protein